jgi:hypothetical protein
MLNRVPSQFLVPLEGGSKISGEAIASNKKYLYYLSTPIMTTLY